MNEAMPNLKGGAVWHGPWHKGLMGAFVYWKAWPKNASRIESMNPASRAPAGDIVILECERART